jgi:tripartite-type tricarboxylate transporter receptor subunit TctC
MSIMLKRIICIALVLFAAPLDVRAQDYPSRPITVIVPFPAGGPSDVVARIVTEEMGKILGQSMVIENIGGAGGTIGSARVAAANPDGYTLLAGSMGSHVAAPVLTPNVKYDSERDFEPIGFTAHAPAVVVANKDFPAKDLRDFVAYLKKQGESVKQAHGGIGSSSHMACLLFASAAGVRPTLVAYRGTGPAAERPHRRTCRFLLRAGGQRCSANHFWHDQGLRRLLQPAAGGAARGADGQGGRRRLSDEHLGRNFRPQRHAEADHR